MKVNAVSYLTEKTSETLYNLWSFPPLWLRRHDKGRVARHAQNVTHRTGGESPARTAIGVRQARVGPRRAPQKWFSPAAPVEVLVLRLRLRPILPTEGANAPAKGPVPLRNTRTLTWSELPIRRP